MSKIVIRIPRDSAKPITFVNDHRLKGLLGHGYVQLRRASHVQPVNQLKRWAFRLLRRLFGETGRVAAWTRNWRGPWRVDLAPSGGPIIQPFKNRQNAIDSEVAWLNRHILKEPVHA